jgi:hypothetical protein
VQSNFSFFPSERHDATVIGRNCNGLYSGTSRENPGYDWDSPRLQQDPDGQQYGCLRKIRVVVQFDMITPPDGAEEQG